MGQQLEDPHITLETLKGEEYIIDSDGNVRGPSGITKKRIEMHVFLGLNKYDGPSSGYPLGFVEAEFRNKSWIKIVESKIVSDEEAEAASRGHIIY